MLRCEAGKTRITVLVASRAERIAVRRCSPGAGRGTSVYAARPIRVARSRHRRDGTRGRKTSRCSGLAWPKIQQNGQGKFPGRAIQPGGALRGSGRRGGGGALTRISRLRAGVLMVAVELSPAPRLGPNCARPSPDPFLSTVGLRENLLCQTRARPHRSRAAARAESGGRNGWGRRQRGGCGGGGNGG